MARNTNYKTTRNKLENQFLGGFKNEGDKNYNSNIIKKYFVNEKKITPWEKGFYNKIKEQEFNITDSQYSLIYTIYLKYKKK
jgi:hypothetical protein